MKNGLKCMLRQPIRCLFYIILSLLVAAYGAFGISLWDSADAMMKASDALYMTRVTVEGASADEVENLVNSKYVIWSNETVYGLGQMDGIENTALEEVENTAILAFQIVDIKDEKLAVESDILIKKITALVLEDYCNHLGSQQYILLDTTQELEEDWISRIEVGHTYFAYGTYDSLQSNYPVFTITYPEWSAAQKAGVDLSSLLTLEDITDTGIPSNEELWRQYAKNIIQTNTLFPMYAFDNAYLWDEFYTGQAELLEGELFSGTGQHACIIDDRFAKTHGIQVGDELPIRFFYDETGNTTQVLWDNIEEKEAKLYRVTGIYKYQTELENAIYISKYPEMHQEVSSNTVVQLQLKNGTSDKFLKQCEGVITEEIGLLIEDQGYEQAILPIRDIYKKAVLLTLLGGGLSIAVMLFIGRSYYNSTGIQLEYLKELGCSRMHRKLYFLSGQIFAVTIGAILGFLGQRYFATPIMTRMLERNFLKYNVNLHYSELAGLENYDAFENLMGDSWFGLISVISLLLLNIWIGSFLCHYGMRKSVLPAWIKKTIVTKRRKKVSKLGSHIRSMTIRLAVQELVRNSKQTIIFILLAFVLTGLVGTVQLVRESQEAAKEKMYEEHEVEGYITSLARLSKKDVPLSFTNSVFPLLSGEDGVDAVAQSYLKLLEELLGKVYLQQLDKADSCCMANQLYQEWKQDLLTKQKHIADFSVNKNLNYEYMGTVQKALEFPEIPFHSNTYGNDSLLKKIPYMDEITFCDNFALLEHTEKESIRYLDGYDEGFLEKSEMIGMVSEDFLQENGLDLGDEIRLAVYTSNNGPRVEVLDVKIVASYVGDCEAMYVPLGLLYGSCFLFDVDHDYWLESMDKLRTQQDGIIYKYYGYELMDRVSGFRYALADNKALDAFREELTEIGYSEKYKVNERRQIVIIEDGAFLQAIQTTEKHIEQTEMIMKLLLVLMIGIVAAASFISIAQVEDDIYLMVELGTPRRKIWTVWVLRYEMAVWMGMVPAIVTYMVVAVLMAYQVKLGLILFVFFEFLLTLLLSVYILAGRIYKNSMRSLRKAGLLGWKK